jgi:hypothetical protein
MLLQRSSPNGMKRSSSIEYLSISECVQHTVQGMWGNAPRAEPVRAIKRIERDLSVGFGPQKECAAALLRADALQGALPIYVRPRPTVGAKERSPVEPAVGSSGTFETGTSGPMRPAGSSDAHTSHGCS